MCEKCDKLRSSAAFVAVCSPRMSVTEIDTTLLGLAITLGKPIILVCPPNHLVPEKLLKIVDRRIDFDPDFNVVVESVKAALVEMGIVGAEAARDADQDDFGPKPSLN